MESLLPRNQTNSYGDAVFDDHEIHNNLLMAVAHKINWLCRHGWKEYNLTKTHNKLKLKDVLWVVQNDWVFRWCTDTDSEQVVMKVINDTVRARDQQHRFCVVTDKITGDDYVQCIQSRQIPRNDSWQTNSKERLLADDFQGTVLGRRIPRNDPRKTNFKERVLADELQGTTFGRRIPRNDSW